MHNQMIRGHSMWPCIIQGVLNRRFKRVFAYFWRGPKVGRRPGAGARNFQKEEKRSRPAGLQIKLPFAPEGREDEINKRSR